MPGTPAHTIFKVQVRRLPGVTNEQWRGYIQDAVATHWTSVEGSPAKGIDLDDVAVHNFKRRPILGYLLVHIPGTRNDFPKFFLDYEQAHRECTWALAEGIKVRVTPLVADKNRAAPMGTPQ